MRMSHSIKLGKRRRSRRSVRGWAVQVWAGSTRTANTLALCAVRRLKKKERSREIHRKHMHIGKGKWCTSRWTCVLLPGGQLLKCARFCVDLRICRAQCVTAKWRLWLSHYTPRMATKQPKKKWKKLNSKVKTARYFFLAFSLPLFFVAIFQKLASNC